MRDVAVALRRDQQRSHEHDGHGQFEARHACGDAGAVPAGRSCAKR